MVEDFQNSTLRKGIHEFVTKYGPVSFLEIVVGGTRTGFIDSWFSTQAIIATIHLMIDTSELDHSGSYRLDVPRSNGDSI